MSAGAPSATARTIAAAVVLAARDRGLAPFVAPTAAEWSERFLSRAPGGPLLLRSLRPALGRLAWSAVERAVQPGIIRHWLARKRWIEARVRAGLDAGATKLVVIGAGLDTLGVRLALERPSLEVIEVDHPATQAIKREAMGARAPVRLLPCDLVHDPLPWQHVDDQPTIVVLEGVLMYLDERDVRTLLRRVLELPSSRLHMMASFMVSALDRVIAFEPRRPIVDRWLRLVREPFRSALRPGAGHAFLASITAGDHGWRVTGHADATTLEALGLGRPMARGEEVFECERVRRRGATLAP